VREPGGMARALAEVRANPARSDRWIAHAARCSPATVQRARRRLESPAAERLPVFTPECERCGAPISGTSQAGNVRRFYSAKCRRRASEQRADTRRKARLAGAAPEPEDPGAGRRWPTWSLLPKPPDWSRGLCTAVTETSRGLWTSELPSERAAAVRICRRCPVQAECAEWSMSLPSRHDQAIYGGLTPDQRRRKRAALALSELAAQAR
jgi:hypothetical protein